VQVTVTDHYDTECYDVNCALPPGFRDAGHIARDALGALLTAQDDLGVLRSLSILITAAKDLVEDPPVNVDLTSEDLLIYRPLAST